MNSIFLKVLDDKILVEANFGWLNDCAYTNYTEKDIYFYHKDHLGSSNQITDKDAVVIHHIEYMPSGEQFLEQRSTWGTSYKFNGKELDQETGLYYYGARYYNPTLSIWGSVDPKSDDYPHQSPFMFCSGNPVVRVDMDGMSDDWVQDSKSLEYKWMDNVTSPSNTPSGYNYVGPNDSDIINHMGLGGKQPTESSNRIGYVAGDVEEGRYAVNHMVNVKAKSDIAITANISYNLNSTDENNKSGRQFKGISISATLINYNSGVDGKISTTAKLNVSYGGKNYISNFTDGNGDMIKQPGSSISNANISIPARALNSSNKMNINITGQWWVRNSSNLNTPVVYHPLTPLPQKFSHGWKF